MPDQFHHFGKAVQEQFNKMSEGELFTVDIDRDALYEAYQAAFPAGTNEVFRKQREHECSTCRNFIKNIGGVVSINADLTIDTVWNVVIKDKTYQTVAVAMDKLVRAAAINGLFRSEETQYGGKPNKDGESNIVWNHLHGVLNSKHHVSKNATKSAAAVIGEYNTDLGVFKRGMTELTVDAIVTVADLIATNNLYRGTEKAAMVTGLSQLHNNYGLLKTEQERNAFLFKNLKTHGALAKNDVIGTLLVALSDGMPLEQAVKTYEDKVSGTNYKRPTALITPRMVEDAMKTIKSEGIEDSLHRRLATIEDVAVTDVLYVDNDVRTKMKGGVANLLMDAAITSAPNGKEKSEDISITHFMAVILPKAKKLELLVSNAHQGNFMVLTAPVYPDTANLFKWDNAFGWSYDGNITDSIKERVKAAGGNTSAALRVSLAWFNHDDLDLHVIEPDKNEIYFGTRGNRSKNGGMLDVDMNAGRGTTREPVENIVWNTGMKDGQYRVVVHNYSKRETTNPGFTLEVESNGHTQHYSSRSSPSSGAANGALLLTLKNGQIVKVDIGTGIEGRSFSQEKWGVKTEQFTSVDSMMLSPNHWGHNDKGHKHFFFVLDGCKTDVPARGIYNEFLEPRYDKHRKVFEVLGNKMMCEPTTNQLAGVGFSSTKQDKVTVRVNGHQLYNVQF